MKLEENVTEKMLVFDDKEISVLFGHEAAENERPKRLQEYYLKGDVYERVMADLP